MIVFRLLPLLSVGFLAGCGGAVSLQIPISGATTASIEFAKGVPLHAENDDIRIEKALLNIDYKTKLTNYEFIFRQLNKGDRPTYVKVEDVTDDSCQTLVEDRQPVLKDERWTGTTPPLTPDESNSKWLFELENSIRVYRFTILTSRGRTWVLYEASSYPGYAKSYYREHLGLDAQAKAAH